MSHILVGLFAGFGGILGGVVIIYLQSLIPKIQGPLLADIDKVIAGLNPNEKAALNGAILILKQEFPQAANGGAALLVAALVAKYPQLAPLQPLLVSFLQSVEGEVLKDVAVPEEQAPAVKK